MQSQLEKLEKSKYRLSIVADGDELAHAKQAALKKLANSVKVPGFRSNKAPLSLVEKQVDQAALQSETIDHAVSDLYENALNLNRLRPVATPEIKLVKFVPFSTLEFNAEVEAIGEVKLPVYKN